MENTLIEDIQDNKDVESVSDAVKKNNAWGTALMWKSINIILNTIKKIGYIFHNTIICIRRGYPLSLIYCCDVHIQKIPLSTVFSHPLGIVINRDTKIGEGCIFQQNVTVGGRRQNEHTAPTLGNNVNCGAGSIILGNVVIGDNVKIGAGAIILKDVPPNTTVVGVWK